MEELVAVGSGDEVSVGRDGDVATITLNRPARLNAFDLDMARLLLGRLQELGNDRHCAAVVITGAGRGFCAGGDLAWIHGESRGVGAAFHALAGCFHEAVLEIAQMEKPVIAAINGIAAGGGFSLTLACDFRVMDRTAVLRQAYTSTGLSIDGGGTFVLPRLVGLARALEIATLDEPLDAEQALTLGLVTRVVDLGCAADGARGLARELTARSSRSFAASKHLLRGAFETTLAAQLDRERQAIVACASHQEGQEGLEAFIEKRKADFRHARCR